ncbi:tetratricopeptide repeat protein, partial [Embleya sp. NPDC056538]
MINSVAIHVQHAVVLPAEAYGAIPEGAASRGVSNIPATRLFVGRDGELDALDAAFAAASGVVLHTVHGLGGVGKSALAAHWAARRPERLRWWITADSAATVNAGLVALAMALQPGLAGLPAELQRERAVQWLAENNDWLLVLDNVENPHDVSALLNRVNSGRVLATSRRATGWHHLAATARLGAFAPAEALELFTRVLTHDGSRTCDGADAVCAEVGHLALAVEQAAAYCAETGSSPRDYLLMLQAWPTRMYAETAEGGDAGRTVARIWRITLDRLVDTPLAGDLLRTLAWYAPDRIPRDLLDDGADPPELARALGRLVAYSMVTDNHDGTLTVHRLVQALARTPDPGDPHRQPEPIHRARDRAAARLADAFPRDVNLPRHWPRSRALLPHLDALVRHGNPEHDTLATGYVLELAALYQQHQGALGSADTYLQRALAVRRRLHGEVHPNTLTTWHYVADVYRESGDLARAVPMFEGIVADRVRVLGNDHPDTLASRTSLAFAYQKAGDLARAVPMFEGIVADRVRVLGNDHPDTTRALNNLAFAFLGAGNPARAVPMFERSLADLIRVLGNDHPDTLKLRDNLAHAYQETRDLARAAGLHERNLADRVRVLGNDHPDTMTSLNNLALTYQESGDPARALPMFERNLANLIRVLGNDHPDTMTSLNNLASAYQ